MPIFSVVLCNYYYKYNYYKVTVLITNTHEHRTASSLNINIENSASHYQVLKVVALFVCKWKIFYLRNYKKCRHMLLT